MDLMDKMNVSYKQGEFVAYKRLIDLKKMQNKEPFQKTLLYLTNLSLILSSLKKSGKCRQVKAGIIGF